MAELEWTPHRFLEGIEKTTHFGCSVLRGMTNFGYKKDFEVMKDGDVRRFATLEEAIKWAEKTDAEE